MYIYISYIYIYTYIYLIKLCHQIFMYNEVHCTSNTSYAKVLELPQSHLIIAFNDYVYLYIYIYIIYI